MQIDFGRLFVDRLIIHDVPIAPTPVVLSEVESELDDGLRTYFAERLRRSLQKGFDVEVDPAIASNAPELIEGLLADGADLVEASQRLADHLHGIQKGVNSPGLLVVALLTLEGKRAVSLLKLERERGMRAEQSQDSHGLRTFQLDVIKSLLFTDNTQVFKAAAFRHEQKKLVGKASDNQAAHGVTDVAHFFLRAFLGCRFAVAPETATRGFFEAAQTFINDRVADPVAKTRYELALLTELGSEKGTIEPREFATAYFREQDRQPFVSHLTAQGVATDRIVKSLELIGKALQRVQYEFSSGVKVLVRPDLLEQGDIITVEEADAGRTRLSITDELTRLKSAG